ncbi:MAG TPA: creatininase family protein [Xanthobacteraceae bacterium]|jgi:creatinine amidohydrolase|nr:creatininase family protein [Xanthobacteraceae bacterium]
MTEVAWNRLTAEELREKAAQDAIVLLPVASTEQHGPHLTTGVDMFLAGEGCRRAAQIVSKTRPIVVAPVVWMGLAEHHIAFGGTFSLSISTYHALLRDLCRSILRAGFKKILIVNGHGGNIAALNALITDLTHELDAPIATTTLYNLPHESGAYAKILEDQQGVRHACEAETSMMLAIAPDCVRRERIGEAFGPGGNRGLGIVPALNLWKSFQEITPSGVMGDARKATAEKGEKLFDSAAELLAERLIAGEPWKLK